MQEVIDRLNELFGAEFTQGQTESFVDGSITALLENGTLVAQAGANTEKQFAESPDLKEELLATIADNRAAHGKIVDFMFSDNLNVEVVISAFAKAFHAAVQASASD